MDAIPALADDCAVDDDEATAVPQAERTAASIAGDPTSMTNFDSMYDEESMLSNGEQMSVMSMHRDHSYGAVIQCSTHTGPCNPLMHLILLLQLAGH